MRSLSCQQIEFICDTAHLLKISDRSIYRFLSGGADTGKSYVLKALREIQERFYKSRIGADFRQCWTMTLAPTGKAAFLAGENTINSVLRVPASQCLSYHRLDNDTLNSVRKSNWSYQSVAY